MQAEPLITLTQARKILGKKSEEMSDSQISELLETLQMMAESHLSNEGS